MAGKRNPLDTELQRLLREHPDAATMELLIPDVLGILRGKRIRRQSFEKTCRDGFWFCAGTVLIIYIVIFIIFILIAIWVYKDAEKRGMSGVLWLIIVILLGIIGLIIYLVVRSSHPIQQQPPAGYYPPGAQPPPGQQPPPGGYPPPGQYPQQPPPGQYPPPGQQPPPQ